MLDDEVWPDVVALMFGDDFVLCHNPANKSGPVDEPEPEPFADECPALDAAGIGWPYEAVFP